MLGDAARAVRKYLHVINIGIQNTLVYRVNFLFRSSLGLIPLMGLIFLWRAIYEGRGEDAGTINGYTLSHMISYYLIVTVVDALTGVAEDDWQIAADIRDGAISQFMVKPVNYIAYRLSLFFSGRLIYTAVAALPVGIFIFLQREHFVVPPDAATAGLFALSLLMSALLQFFISVSMALLAFWVLEVSSFIFILFALEYIAGGHMFPLDILPQWFQNLLMLTPFPYQMYFPVSIYLGQSTGPELISGLAMQATWVGIAFLMVQFVWRRGIRHYEAVGG